MEDEKNVIKPTTDWSDASKNERITIFSPRYLDKLMRMTASKEEEALAHLYRSAILVTLEQYILTLELVSEHPDYNPTLGSDYSYIQDDNLQAKIKEITEPDNPFEPTLSPEELMSKFEKLNLEFSPRMRVNTALQNNI